MSRLLVWILVLLVLNLAAGARGPGWMTIILGFFTNNVIVRACGGVREPCGVSLQACPVDLFASHVVLHAMAPTSRART